MNHEIHSRPRGSRLWKSCHRVSLAVYRRGNWRQPASGPEKSAPPSTAAARATHAPATSFPRPAERGAADAIAEHGETFAPITGRYRQPGLPHS